MENNNKQKTVINIESVIKHLVVVNADEDKEELNEKITSAVNSALDKCVKNATILKS